MKKRTRIGVLHGNINPAFNRAMSKGILKCASEKNADVVFLVPDQLSKYYANGFETDRINDYVKYLGIDAMLITYESHRDTKDILDNYKDIPYVLLQDIPNDVNKSCIVVDNKTGFEELIEHLISHHNYKKILYFSGPENLYDGFSRKQIYVETMKKHNLNVTSKMIAYGDFSDDIEDQLRLLLKNNKDVEAIVFANDTMAIASYPILESMGYTVGKDIAVTGFDDIKTSAIVHPSLTTVHQNVEAMGYNGVEEVLRFLKTKKSKKIKLENSFILRNSCGCDESLKNGNYYTKDIDSLINKIISDSYNESVALFDREVAKEIINDLITELISKDDYDNIMYKLKDITKHYIEKNYDMINVISSLLFYNLKELNPNKSSYYNNIFIEYHKWFIRYSINIVENENEKYISNLMLSNYYLRDSFNENLSRVDLFETVFNQLKTIDVKSSYIYLFDDVNDNKKRQNLYLEAYYEGTESYLGLGSSINILDDKNDYLANKNMLSFSLTSGKKQYGFMVCETSLNNVELIQAVCSQLCTILYLDEIKKSQQKIQQELEETYKKIEKTNEVLNNISKIDELTKTYNRRGLLEEAYELIHNNIGCNMEILFLDLDHLKEINDTFGHKEGDFAICKIAEIIKSSLPKDAIISRLGGDEFVAIYKINNKDIVKTIQNKFKIFNNASDKDYYIEASIGRDIFISSANTDIISLLNQADKFLYESKKKRRITIVK